MKLKLTAILFAAFFAVGLKAQTLTTNSYFQSVNTIIPDDNPNGLASSVAVSGIYGSIEDISLTLDISGGYNGDLYAYLVNTNTGVFSILLNRVGVQGGPGGTNEFGYSDSGFNVTFTTEATNDIHFYQDLNYTLNGNGALQGTWGADGRNIDPGTNAVTLGDTPQTALMSDFLNTDPNGDWVLFLSDMSLGSESTLQDWQLNIISAPEPASWALLVLGIFLLINFFRHHRIAKRKMNSAI